MTVSEFLSVLQSNPDKTICLRLPGGGQAPLHFHVTEVGHVMRRFVDCGGTRRSAESCLLQVWVANDEDHRLSPQKLAGIFQAAGDLLPHRDLPVEFEYEDEVISQFPVTGSLVQSGTLTFQLAAKHTDCLAKEKCLPGESCGVPAASGASQTACCAGGSCCG